MSAPHYWPGSLTWPEIVERIRSWSDGPITRDEAYEVMHIASILGVFTRREEQQVSKLENVRVTLSSEGDLSQLRTLERDTQFIGFANALVDDLRRNVGMGNDERLPYVQLIARRAYDLVKHAIEHIEHIDLDRLSSDEQVSKIPDLAELPKEP